MPREMPARGILSVLLCLLPTISLVVFAARTPPLLKEATSLERENSWESRHQRHPFDTSNYGKLQLDNGLARTPQMGWNSWNFFACNINETVIMETADALISTGLADLGYIYVNVDDCWSAPLRNLKGDLVANQETFLSGIKALADYIHEKGLKLGIYSDAGYGMQTVLTENFK